MPEDTNQGGAGAGSTGAAASGQQDGSQTTQTSTQQPAGSQATQQPAQQTSTQQTGQAGSTTEFRYKEDRSDWMPRHRYNEAAQKSRQLEEQNQDLNRRLTIALGGEPTDPNAQKQEQLRTALFQMFPQLKRLSDLSDEQLEEVLATPQHVSASRQAEAQQWQRHGQAQIDSIATKVAEAIGSESLDDDQKGDLRISLKAWLETRVRTELAQAADRYGDDAVQRDERRFSPTLQRYEGGDAKLLDEFVTRYTKNWVEPARRSATARTSNRTRPVPDSSGRSAVTSVQRPTSFKSWDERLDYAAKVAKERGVSFDRN